jgi:hypothetical protein
VFFRFTAWTRKSVRFCAASCRARPCWPSRAWPRPLWQSRRAGRRTTGRGFWARVLGATGHEVRLIAPQLARPCVKRDKNDAAEAEALCEAAGSPTMRFVPHETAGQQAALLLACERGRLVRERTRLASTVRGHRPWPIPRREHPQSGCKAAGFGIVAGTGVAHLGRLLALAAADRGLPVLARELLAGRRCPAAGVAPRQRGVAPPGYRPRHRAGHGVPTGDKGRGPRRVQVRPRLRGLAGPDAQGPPDGGQGETRRDHARRRRGPAQPARRGRHLRHTPPATPCPAQARPGAGAGGNRAGRGRWRCLLSAGPLVQRPARAGTGPRPIVALGVAGQPR